MNNIKKPSGSHNEMCIADGNQSKPTQTKHFVPAKGVGLRKLVARKFMVVTANGFWTSKLCRLCHTEVLENNRIKKLFRCLLCKECVSSESKETVFITCDLNAAVNIRNLAKKWVYHQTRSSVFCRTGNWPPWPKMVEKVGQNVNR